MQARPVVVETLKGYLLCQQMPAQHFAQRNFGDQSNAAYMSRPAACFLFDCPAGPVSACKDGFWGIVGTSRQLARSAAGVGTDDAMADDFGRDDDGKMIIKVPVVMLCA